MKQGSQSVKLNSPGDLVLLTNSCLVRRPGSLPCARQTGAYNTLNWKANSTDPSYFSVQLLNSNNSQLNGNFQIGNALSTANGTAQIYIDRIPTGTYSILFVNSSNYQLDRPEVYYTSSSFEVKPNGTEPAQVTPNTNADPSSSSSGSSPSGSSSSASSSSSAQASATPSSQNSNSAFSTEASLGAAALGAIGLGLSLLC
ncbi:hypothetical protein IE53DRAFT_385674 [Violaceomyces palustris]|uniref:Uncharacterized protein n=1 Tax=Violaceomyces palustris TaxID=1673888 RepID=A0ACD0P1P7_9BASI|nr:hypothetical protein IE53DRAFT_385674 [Violaceomyces palustris]